LILVSGSPSAATVPVVHEDAKLTASDAATQDRFGRSVSVSGETAVVGADRNDDAGSASGSAYVFVRDGFRWIEQTKLTASDAKAFDLFGFSVAISGETAVIGASEDDQEDLYNAGSAYVFVRNGTDWTEQAMLTASDMAAEDKLGWDVAVSGDTAVVSAILDDDAGSSSGSAYVFVRNGTDWSQQVKLTASDAEEDDTFGYSVSLSGDTAVIGAPFDVHANSTVPAGSAYVFVRNGTVWSEQAKLTSSDATGGDNFGYAVALSGDTAVIGARRDDDAGSSSGSAYVFVRNGMTWSQQAKLTASDAATGDWFGVSVAVDGDTTVVGAQYDDQPDVSTSAGAAYVFVRGGTGWNELLKLTASDAVDDPTGNHFGNAVAVSGDIAVVAAEFDDHEGFLTGSAYVFEGVPQEVPAASKWGLVTAMLLLLTMSTATLLRRPAS
jgi:hypothetical protein